MSRWCLCRLLPGLGLLLPVAALAQTPTHPLPTQVEVLTQRDYPLTGLEALARAGLAVQVYDLDAPRQLSQALSQGLPQAPQAARAAALTRLQGLDRAALARQAGDAYAGVLAALRYGLDRYPAVIFDGGAAVVYGVTDLRQALRYYQRWRAQEGRP